MRLISFSTAWRETFSLRSVGGCVATAVALWSCGPVDGPLAIRMYNPKTQQTLHCTARSQSPEYTAVLAKTVEACAQQLEARGFVRDN